MAWGLRGHEKQYPDSEKIYVELDRASVGGRNVRGGLAGLGLLEKVQRRTYRLTPAGLAAASKVVGATPSIRAKAERSLADAIENILSHPVFQDWTKDPALPKHFRDAGHFWGIAAGTPPSVIRRRITEIDLTLDRARATLDQNGRDEVASFSRTDLQRAAEFQSILKVRFAKELKTLQAAFS
jgi:hypothetical protein